MKIIKITGIMLSIIILIFAGSLTWLFSESGNNFLKNKITEVVNKQAPIGLKFTHFKIDFGSYEFGITDDAQSQIAIGGDFDILLNTNATLNMVIKNLSPYEGLIGTKLNGGISLNGNIKKDSNKIDVKAELLAFNSKINADISMLDYSPKRLFLESKEGIDIKSLLHFLNQNNYASGKILLNADMDISDINSPNGGFHIASKNILPNTSLLKKDFNIIIPNSGIMLAINGEAKKDDNNTGILLADILASSSYMNITSDDISLRLNDNSTNGAINVSIKNISINNFKPNKQISTNLILKSKDIKTQEAALSLNIVKNPIIAHIEMPNYKPRSLNVNGDSLRLEEILQMANMKYDAKGNIDINANITDIDTTNMKYKIDANLKSDIESVVFDGINLASNNYLNANINGSEKLLEIQASSNIFDSNTDIESTIENYYPKTANIKLNNLNLQKLAKTFDHTANGFLNANIEIDNFENLGANFDIDSKEITISDKTLNTLSGMNFKKPITFKLDGDGKFNNGNGTANINISGDDINLSLEDIMANIQDKNYSAFFNFNTPNIANINPTNMNLNGKLSFNGKAGLQNEIPFLSFKNSDFGDLKIELANEKLNITGNNLDVKKLADFSGNGKIIKGGNINIKTNLDIKNKDLVKNLNGDILITGQKLELYSIDIDSIAKTFDSNSKVNLYNIGSMVIAGPLGLSSTKNNSFGSYMINSKTAIRELKANFDVENGVMHTRDVAFSTGKTRIAANGAINLNNQQFQNFSVGLLEDNNCAKYEQKITGKLDDPKFEVTKSTIENALNIAASLFDKIKKGSGDILRQPKNENCTPFYNGTVR